LALSISDPVALVLSEPASELALAAPAAIRAELCARAAAGCCVVVLTSSPGDAELLGSELHVLRHGRLLGSAPLETWWPLGARELVVWLDPARGADARTLARALGERSEIGGVGWQSARAGGEPELVAVRGARLDEAALALSDECAKLGVAVLSLHTSSPSVDELLRDAGLRAAQAGVRLRPIEPAPVEPAGPEASAVSEPAPAEPVTVEPASAEPTPPVAPSAEVALPEPAQSPPASPAEEREP
jgi:hypothetical protein